MNRKLSFRQTAAISSMLFGLFFGAGNLIFPVHMGQMAGSSAIPAVIGFILTGVGLPLLGVAAMGISGCSGLTELSSRIGHGYGRLFTCALYLTIGPLFAIPRCAATSFTIGIEPLLNTGDTTMPLLIFSVLFFVPVLLLSLKPGSILTWIGRIINPAFLALLFLLIIVSLVKPMGSLISSGPLEEYTSGALVQGFLEGYNTMDALAALVFGIIIIRAVKDCGIAEPSAIAAGTVKSGAFSCLLMAVIYLLTCLMGARSLGVLSVSENGGIALAQIASHYFGSAGQILLALTILLACLKTSVGLVTSCSETFADLFPRIRYRSWAVFFCLFSFAAANLGLTLLIAWSVPVLRLLYPLSITLILLTLFGRFFGNDRRVLVWTTGFTLAASFLDCLSALPAEVNAFLHAEGLALLVRAVLPWSDIGLGWVIPAFIGLVIGLVLRKAGTRHTTQSFPRS